MEVPIQQYLYPQQAKAFRRHKTPGHVDVDCTVVSANIFKRGSFVLPSYLLNLGGLCGEKGPLEHLEKNRYSLLNVGCRMVWSETLEEQFFPLAK